MNNYTVGTENIELDSQLLGSGGEGKVYKILKPKKYAHKVAKIFDAKRITPEREQKLRYLVKNRPAGMHAQSLIWPEEIIEENGKFVGFVMPAAKGKLLEYFCDDADTFLQYPEFQNQPEYHKIAFREPNAIPLRLKIAFNICSAIASVHACKDYVLVDLKPTNIMIEATGEVYVIDIDSVQITDKGKVLFPSVVATPEYSPPESHTMQPSDKKEEYWDRFSLAVIIYKILIGLHPFSGTLKPPYQNITTHEALIREGFYVHGKKNNQFSTIHKSHNKVLSDYGQNIFDAFLKAFEGKPHERPSAAEWKNLLQSHTPLIHRFFSDKDFIIQKNEIVRIQWQVEHFTKLELHYDKTVLDVTQNTSNYVDIPLSQDTTFELHVTGKFHSQKVVSNCIRISTKKPNVSNFFSDKTYIITRNEKIYLRWNAAYFTKLELIYDGNTEDVTQLTSKSVSIQKTTDFELRASNDFGKVSKKISINTETPKILSFQSNPSVLIQNQPVTLTWTVQYATKVELIYDGNTEDVTQLTSKNVSIQKTTDFELRASNDFGQNVSKLTVKADVPEVIDFQADKYVLIEKKPVTLTWTVQYATKVELIYDGNTEDVTQLTSKNVAIQKTTEFKLRASNGFGQVSKKVIIKVGAPDIINFKSDKRFVFFSGDPTGLSWQVEHAKTIELIYEDGNKKQDLSNTPNGNLSIRIDTPTRFILEATNDFGKSEKYCDIGVLSLPAPKVNVSTHVQVGSMTVKNMHSYPKFPTLIVQNINAPKITTSGVNSEFNFKTKNNGNFYQKLKDDYQWTENILQNSNGYQITFSNFITYKAYQLGKKLFSLFKKVLVKIKNL
jgi:hypothetical protein